MKLSLVFELLLIFVLLAFAASKTIRNKKNNKKNLTNRHDISSEQVIPLEDSSINRYCKCSEAFCNCCRDFALPLVKLDGPGCATLMYLNGDKMAVSLSFGRKVITNKTLSSRKPSPVCMPLPGGISKFCGRVYNIARSGEEFRACLGLELQSRKTIEAAVRVSCFKFGPRGVSSEPADPLPLVPQNEKGSDDDEDDDDDDDDDDDFDLVDDDDSDLAGINDVDGGDYTGFSLLGEDLLGDLFGESSTKKKSNKNKKKQAPTLSTTTTTTTTKRPRPNRRPTRKPSSRATTVRPIRTTTVKVRPATGNKRTTRKPSRRPNRPNRRPTITPAVTENSIPSSISTSTMTTPASIVLSAANTPMPTTISPQPTANDETFEPVVIVTQKPHFTMSIPTEKPETNFEDPGLEMSLAHITGQLSAMPETSIISEAAKDTGMMSTMHDQEHTAYEKIETITPKGTTVSFPTSSEQRVNGDMIQVVQNLDSTSEETVTDSKKEEEKMTAEETRTTHFQDNSYVPMIPLRKNRNSDFNLEDLDILGLDKIGETVGDQLGLFGRNKRQHKHKDTKVHGENYEIDNYDVLGLETIGEAVGDQLGLLGRNKRQKKHKDTRFKGSQKEYDYDMLGLDTVGESLGLERSEKNNKNRRRQNKMMRGEWSKA